MLMLKEKNFSKTKNSLKLPYLLSLQKESWDSFWKQGLKELFQEIFPIKNYTGDELELWFTDYRLDESKYKTDLDAKKNNDSYEASLERWKKLKNGVSKVIVENGGTISDHHGVGKDHLKYLLQEIGEQGMKLLTYSIKSQDKQSIFNPQTLYE